MTIDRTSPDNNYEGTKEEPLTIADLREQATLVRDNLVEDLARARRFRDNRNAEIRVLVGQLEEADRAVKALTPRAKKAAK